MGTVRIKPIDYDQHGNDPTAWWGQARQLLDSANLHRRFGLVRSFAIPKDEVVPEADPFQYRLGRDDTTGMTYFTPAVSVWPEWMLRGFATECLLKALWLCQGHQLCGGGKYRGVIPIGAKKKVRDHELAELASAVGFDTTPDEREAPLQMWTFAMVGLGRYPVGVNAEVVPQFASPQLWLFLQVRCLEVGDQLMQRLDRAVQSTIPGFTDPHGIAPLEFPPYPGLVSGRRYIAGM